MDVELINPFIRSTRDLFSTMLGTEVERGKISVTPDKISVSGIIVLVSFSGEIQGTVALVFPEATGELLAKALLCSDTVSSDDVADSMAEIGNIIAGGAKTDFISHDGTPLNLSVPTVLRGENTRIDYPVGGLWVDVNFDSKHGPFSLHITFPDSLPDSIPSPVKEG